MLGPHEGKEWALMMAGEKDIAFFSGELGQDYYVMPEEFLACVDNRHARIGYLQAPDAYSHVFYRRGCEAKAARFVQVLELSRKHYHDTDDYDIETGRLLGYSEADIAFYIRHIRQRRGGDSGMT